MIVNILAIGDKLKEIIEGALKINFAEFIINIAATILLILIVRFFFWNKVTNFLDKKKKHIADEYKVNDELRKEALKEKEEADELLKSSKNKSNKVIEEATISAKEISTEIIMSAKNEASKIKDDSIKEAQRNKELILNEAKDEIVDIASKMASKIINEKVDKDSYNDKVLDSLEDNNG